MAKEKKTDIIVARLLTEAGIYFTPEESCIVEVNEALKTASKRDTGRKGFPEFVAQSGDFILVIEDKPDAEHQAKYMNGKNDTLLMDTKSKELYAENGALHYALKIIQNTTFKRVIAFGCSGTEKDRLRIRPIYVSPTGYKLMPMVKDFSWFAADKIDRYYNEKICENKPIEQVELEEIIRRAGKLHEDLRTYGQLGETEKPLVVSAILLALCEDDFSTEDLNADKVKTDGMKIYSALSTHLDRVQVQPEVKKQRVLNQFTLITDRPHLSEKDDRLGKSPLRYFAEYLNSNILTAITNNSPEDVLGRFYGE
ncbi:MAG: SAM-dependent DNA methyltransferase, partial [Bacteroidaceae bacterium]|nr:SAM-dependent DNA methyltransferase [Bacteroidaceae bacterium]